VIITVEQIENSDACEAGLYFFRRVFPEGLDTESRGHKNRWFNQPYIYATPGDRVFWLVDLVVWLLGRRFTGCRCLVPRRQVTPLMRELWAYMMPHCPKRGEIDLWKAIWGHAQTQDSLWECLQQVARRVENG
jgi:hypothetical protein